MSTAQIPALVFLQSLGHVLPEELVEVSVLHVLKDHDERVSVHANPVELHYVLVLQVSQQLGFPLEILPRCKSGILQSLWSEGEVLSESSVAFLVSHQKTTLLMEVVFEGKLKVHIKNN